MIASRTCDIAEVLRACLALASDWSNPDWGCAVGSGDVYRAYDAVPWGAAARVLGPLTPEAAQVVGEPLWQGAVYIAGATDATTIAPQRGVRTGALESGMLLAQILSHAFGRLPARWAERGLAYFPWSLGLSCFLWVETFTCWGATRMPSWR